MPTLRTWSGHHFATPQSVARPGSAVAVQDLVRRAEGRRVRAFGALHSWSDIALTDGVAVSLDLLSGLVRVDGQRVTVHAGTRLRDLNQLLAQHGLAMPILGSVDPQAIAGAVATGTHGSSRRHGNLASIVRGMKLVTGTGELLEVGEHDPRLDALRVGLGATGIVTELTLDVVPAFHLAETATPMPVREAIARVDELSQSAEFVKLWWLPHTGQAVVFTADRTDEPSAFSPTARWIDEQLVNRLAFRGVLTASRWFPGWTPTLNRVVGAAYFRPQRRVGRSFEVFHLAMPPVHREMEYAFGVEHTRDALTELVDWVQAEELRVNFIVEARFVRADGGWMSPAHGHDVCQLGAYMANSADLPRYFAGFEQRMLALGARPHWGKEFGADGATVLARYPKAEAWWQLVQQLDPDGVFRNRFTDRLFPATAPGNPPQANEVLPEDRSSWGGLGAV